MLKKLKYAFDVLRKGKALKQKGLWTNVKAASAAIAALLLSLRQLADAMGYSVPIDAGQAADIGGGIATAVVVYLSYATTRSAGLPAPGIKLEPVDMPDHIVGATRMVERVDQFRGATKMVGRTDRVAEPGKPIELRPAPGMPPIRNPAPPPKFDDPDTYGRG